MSKYTSSLALFRTNSQICYDVKKQETDSGGFPGLSWIWNASQVGGCLTGIDRPGMGLSKSGRQVRAGNALMRSPQRIRANAITPVAELSIARRRLSRG